MATTSYNDQNHAKYKRHFLQGNLRTYNREKKYSVTRHTYLTYVYVSRHTYLLLNMSLQHWIPKTTLRRSKGFKEWLQGL